MSDKDTETKRTQEEIEADVEKARAEAEQAYAAARESEANARKADAEVRKVTADAVAAEAYAERNLMELDERRRDHEEKLADDKFHHIYFFSTAVESGSVKSCMKQLNLWRRLEADLPRDQKSPIEIVFSSPGGSVIDGMALFDFIQAVRADGHHVTTATIGYAASMAGILLQAGDHRVMGAEAYLLIHEISFGAGGKIGEVEDEVKFIKKIQDRVLEIFANRSHQALLNGTAQRAMTKKEVAEGLSERDAKKLGMSEVTGWKRSDWWLSSSEALALGFVDEVRGSLVVPTAPVVTVDGEAA